MEKKLNLYQKLLEIQKEVMGLGKDKATNTYKYVTGDKVLSHVKPLMNQHGLLLKQEVVSIKNTRQDYRVGITAQLPDGRPKSEILSKVMMRFTWIDCESGEKDESIFGSNGQNDWDKGVGSALTYGERYFLLKFFHIATDEDDIDNPDRKAEEVAARKLAEEAVKADAKIKEDAMQIVKTSLMEDKAKLKWENWISTNPASAVKEQMPTLQSQIDALKKV